MNSTDFLIIYLACGAPFGVYYFLKNRAQNESKMLLIKSFLNFFFWMPYALRLARRKLFIKGFVNAFDKTTDTIREKNIFTIQKDIEEILQRSRLNVSIYEFREIFERYVGLTVAAMSEAKNIHEHEKEIFRVALAKNVECGSICLHRRNRKRLLFHQTAARKDFLQLILHLSEFVSEIGELRNSSIALTLITQDLETRRQLEGFFAGSVQIPARAAVKNVEQDLWKPEIRPTAAARLISRS